jgi:TPR repeat protein
MSTVSRSRRQESEALFLAAERLEEQRKFSKAVRCLSKAAALGHNSSQLNLGNRYASGTGVRKDFKQAEYWYKRAHRGGNTAAAYNLALAHRDSANLRAAAIWFEKALAMKDGSAHIELAKIHLGRRDGKARALKLLKRVARLSDDDVSEAEREEASSLLERISKQR